MHSVKALLERRIPVFSESFAQQARRNAWQERLAKILPGDLVVRIHQVLVRGDELIVYAESAAWAARLRFALADADASLRAGHPEIASVSVRVMPREGAGPGRRSGRKM
jgi:hypothetical protein